MQHYPAKRNYCGTVSDSYDAKRFTTRKGKWVDKKEKLSVTKALRCVDKRCTILDLPCGTGRITEHILELGYRAAAADISPQMIELARHRVGRHARFQGFHQVDGESIALDTDTFDCITSVRLMGHLPFAVKAQVLREMARVARSYLVVTFYMRGPLRSIKWFLKEGTFIRRAPWYPVSRRELLGLFRSCRLTPLGSWRVAPLLSDAVTWLLDVDSP